MSNTYRKNRKTYYDEMDFEDEDATKRREAKALAAAKRQKEFEELQLENGMG